MRKRRDPTSGNEVRNSDALETFLEGPGIDIETFEPTPGRKSLVARIAGTDPNAPSLCLMGHTDVVPVNPDGWDRDPFGGTLLTERFWGRGAVDMLNLTSSQAVAFKHLAQSGFRPTGDFISRCSRRVGVRRTALSGWPTTTLKQLWPTTYSQKWWIAYRQLR